MVTEISVKKDLFNIIAPIHIYFNADSLFKEKAKIGFKKLKKFKDVKFIKDLFLNENQINFSVKLDDLPYHVFWRLYNQLFEEIVSDTIAESEFFIDEFGAKGIKVNGEIIMSGDSHDCYPFYETYELLIQRLKM